MKSTRLARSGNGTATFHQESVGQLWLRKTSRAAILSGLMLQMLSMSAWAVTDLEIATLRSLYTSTCGVADASPGSKCPTATWADKTGWDVGDAAQVCSWKGITCNPPDTGAIYAIDLSSNGLAGTLPDLSLLTSVHSIAINDNQIGGPLPATLGAMKTLDTFSAFKNNFSGPIPPINTLTELQQFQVWGNFLTGPIPALKGLAKLGNFNVSYNFLSGQIPTLSGVGLSSLQEFNIEHNNVTGGIPSLTDLSSLSTFKVGYNQLSGNLPSVPTVSTPLLNNASSTLCPNNLIHRVDLAWDIATGEAASGPEYHWDKDINFPGGFCSDLIFSDGLEPRDLPLG